MVADTPCGPLYARLSVSEGVFGARGIQGGNRPSGARSANPVATTPSLMPRHGATVALSAPRSRRMAPGTRDPLNAPQTSA